MKTTNNTVLITGGSAGIGFEIAKQLTVKGNHVIIIGRDAQRLQNAAAQLGNVTAIQCDVTKEKEVHQLVERINKDFPELNILINNAGSVAAHTLGAGADSFEKAADEMLTNYLSVIGLTEALLPVLSKHSEAAVVTVSSIVALVPSVGIPTYSASKAALHSYTQSLRITLAKTTNVKVFELMPPLVNTEFSKEIGGSKGMPPAEVAAALITGLEQDNYELHVGNTANIHQLALTNPAEALKAMNADR